MGLGAQLTVTILLSGSSLTPLTDLKITKSLKRELPFFSLKGVVHII